MSYHPGSNIGANSKLISQVFHPILVAFEWELTEDTTILPLGCLLGGDELSSRGVPRQLDRVARPAKLQHPSCNATPPTSDVSARTRHSRQDRMDCGPRSPPLPTSKLCLHFSSWCKHRHILCKAHRHDSPQLQPRRSVWAGQKERSALTADHPRCAMPNPLESPPPSSPKPASYEPSHGPSSITSTCTEPGGTPQST